MSLFIVKSTINNKAEVDSFVELIKNKNNNSILTVRTHKDTFHELNETLFYKFMTNNFADVTFDDDKRLCLLSYKDYNTPTPITSTIKFDSSSMSAYTEFKKSFTEHLNSKYETEYYKDGNVWYVGEVLYKKDADNNTTERIPNGSGTIYYDLPSNIIKYCGEFEEGSYDGAGIFYSTDGKISLTANNISSGVPTQKGKLNINYKNKKETILITFNEVWDKLKLSTKEERVNFTLSNDFVTRLLSLYWTKDEIEQYSYGEKSLDDKYVVLWCLMKKQIELTDVTSKETIELMNMQCRQEFRLIIAVAIVIMFVNIMVSIFT